MLKLLFDLIEQILVLTVDTATYEYLVDLFDRILGI